MTVHRLRVFEMADLGVGNRGLAVEHEAHRLHRLDRERLMRLDQCALVCEIVNANRVPRIEGSPERSEYLEPHPSSAIARCPHHISDSSIFVVLA